MNFLLYRFKDSWKYPWLNQLKEIIHTFAVIYSIVMYPVMYNINKLMWFFKRIYELILLNFVKETRKQYINSTVVLLLVSNKTAILTTIINLCTKKVWKRRFLKGKGANPLKGCKPNWTALWGSRKETFREVWNGLKNTRKSRTKERKGC